MSAGPISINKLKATHRGFLGGMRDEIVAAAERGARAADDYVGSNAVDFTHRGSDDSIKKGRAHQLVRTRGGAILKLQNKSGHGKYINNGTRHIRPRWFLRIAAERAGVRIQNELSGRLKRLALNFRR